MRPRRKVPAPALWLATFLLGACAFLHHANAAHVRITTWNLEWFPDGTAKGAPPEKQDQRIRQAADVLRELDPDIILLQEIRDYETCARLAETIKPNTYHVAICSAFKEPFQPGFGKQQVAILAKHPAQAAWSEKWKSMEGVDPPRGFAFAWFQFDGADLGVYSVHLKSNLVMHGDKEAESEKNVKKREVAAHQLVRHMQGMIATAIPTIQSAVVAGDFNTNRDEFPGDATLQTLEQAGFENCMEKVTGLEKITHPGGHGYPDTTFDYVLAKHAQVSPPRIVRTKVSDHYPVTCDIQIPASGNASSSRTKALQPAPELNSSAPASAPEQRTITITKPVNVKIAYGQTVLPAGMKLRMINRTGDSVLVDFMGGTQAVPITSTDFTR